MRFRACPHSHSKAAEYHRQIGPSHCIPPVSSAELLKASPLKTDLDVDVAVIGGGYTGLSAAYHIRKMAPSKRVTVFEARGVGNGASGRNGGMLLPNVANEYLHLGSPPDVHKRVYDLTVESMKNLIALATASGIEGAVDQSVHCRRSKRKKRPTAVEHIRRAFAGWEYP